MLPGLGGPMGRRALPEGRWFDPRGWLVLVGSALFLVLALRQIPCVQTDAGNAVDAIIRLCYSDIPLSWTSSGLGTGTSPVVGHEALPYPPVLGVMLLMSIHLTRLFGGRVEPGADLQTQLDAAQVYFAITIVWLFLSFLVWILTVMLLGRASRGRYRSWDAMWVAGSPVVLTAGLISWELFPIALTSLALLLLARDRPIEAGAVLGLAASAASMPFAVIVAVVVCLVLRRTWRKAAVLGVSLAVALSAVHLPLLLADADAVLAYYRGQVTGSTSYGSVWYLLETMGLGLRETGSLGFMILLAFMAVVVSVLYLRGKQPRIGSLVAAFVFASMVVAPAFPPQMGLWLLFAVVLARPFRPEVGAFTLTQVAYWAAVWGWLSGHLTAAQNGPQNLYFGALIARVAVDVWIIVASLRDAFQFRECPISGDPDGWAEPDESTRLVAPENGAPVGPATQGSLAPDDLVECGGGHAAGDRDFLANADQRVPARHEQHG